MAYKNTLPRPVRGGLRHFLENLQEPVVALNYLLQIKPRKALETIGRFTVNSTIGVGGLIDVAKKRPFNGPHRTNGFAYTLGYYGVKPGPYLFLPLIGPTTLRDVAGRVIDLLVLPSAFGKPFNRPVYSISTTVIRSLDERAEADGQLRQMLSETSDPYGAIRDAYLTKRQAQIDELRGKKANPAGAPNKP
jgi:phospholipid-binding lipoprotein MlaA